jgi:hypothetical protein
MKAQQAIHSAVAQLIGRGQPFERIESAPWVEGIEARLGFGLPASLRLLTSHYRFPPLELGGIEFFSNLGENSDDDLTVAPFRDKGLLEWFRANRRFHFARPTTGSYDPICLESRGKQSAAVEQIDHEDILLCRKKVRSSVLSSSLEELLQRAAA